MKESASRIMREADILQRELTSMSFKVLILEKDEKTKEIISEIISRFDNVKVIEGLNGKEIDFETAVDMKPDILIVEAAIAQRWSRSVLDVKKNLEGLNILLVVHEEPANHRYLAYRIGASKVIRQDRIVFEVKSILKTREMELRCKKRKNG